jgi:hypothetical protein
MSPGKKFALGIAIAGLVASLIWIIYARRKTITVSGAVITANADPRKQLPIAGAEVAAWDGVATAHTTSDASGLFSFKFRKRLLRGRPTIKLSFRHADYEPKEMTVNVSGDITVAELVPLQPARPLQAAQTKTISNVLVRYSVKAATEVNVGSVVRSFEVANTGNTPCNGRPLCSPDGKWKAARGTISLDAGAGNEFRNARASCIAGPCPFTHIDTAELEHPGRMIRVTAATWSDTATFLVEAEVVHPMVSEAVRHSYPVVFGDALNFTLPPAAEGISLQADENGQSIIFPLGPTLALSWANCNARSNPDQTRVYRCELKPGYRWAKTSSS